jgi:hypothetical protein
MVGQMRGRIVISNSVHNALGYKDSCFNLIGSKNPSEEQVALAAPMRMSDISSIQMVQSRRPHPTVLSRQGLNTAQISQGDISRGSISTNDARLRQALTTARRKHHSVRISEDVSLDSFAHR